MIVRILLLFTLLFSFETFAWNTPTAAFSGNQYSAWTWTGATGDGQWTTGGNWCGAYVNGSCQGQSGAPPATASVVFNNACTGVKCNVTLAGTVTVTNWQMQANYTGTITQGSIAVTIRNTYYQASGTFTAGSGSLTVDYVSAATGNFTLAGGTFTGSSGAMQVGDSNCQACSFTLSGGAFTAPSSTLWIYNYGTNFTGVSSFSANGGLIALQTPNHSGATQTLTFPNSITFHNLELAVGNGHTITTPSTITMDGDLTLNGYTSSAAGVLSGTGSITLTQGSVYRTGYNLVGVLPVIFAGTGTQTLSTTGVNSGYTQFPALQIKQTSSSASVQFTGDISITGGYSALAATDSGTVNVGSSNVSFDTVSSGLTYDSDITTFPSLTLLGAQANMAIGTVLAGNLIASYNGASYINNTTTGVFKVTGNVTATAGSFTGALLTLELDGTGTQTVDTTGSAYNFIPGLRLNKASGSVVLQNTSTGVSKIGGGFTYVSTAGMATSSITLPSDLYLGANGSTTTSAGFQFPAATTIHWLGSGGLTSYIADDLYIRGNLALDAAAGGYSKINGVSAAQTVNVYGNVTCSTGGISTGTTGNLVTMTLAGSSQTIDYTAAVSPTYIPNLIVSSTGAVTVTSGSNSINTNNYTYNSGTVDATASTFKFTPSAALTLNPGTTAFGNVTFIQSGTVTIASGQTLIVNGALADSALVTTRTLTGNIDVYGNVSFTGSYGITGTATLNLKGSNSTFSKAVAMPTGLLTVAKNSGQSVTLSAVTALSSGANVSVTGGSITMGGFNFTIPGSLTLASGTSVSLGGGTLNVNGSNVPAGSYSSGTITP